MFERIRKLFSGPPPDPAQHADSQGPMSVSESGYAPVSEWAATQGFEFLAQGLRQAFAVTGDVRGRPWRLELGPPSRSYVVGEELRARADLGTPGEIAVVVMSRPLKALLQAQADLRAAGQADAPMQTGPGEELDWLAQYPEVRWDGPPDPLWSSFAVLAQRPQDAAAWLEPELVRQLLAWPLLGVRSEVPFLLLLLNGKLMLRMEYFPADLATLQHAAGIFTNACESALAVFPAPDAARKETPDRHRHRAIA